MFTLADIRNIAIQIEKNGEDTYRLAGSACKNPEVAKQLLLLADDEKHHGEWLATLTSSKPLSEEQREMEAVGKALLQDMIKGNPFLLSKDELQRAESVGEVLRRSQIFEQDTIVFYQFIKGFLDTPEAASQMQKIIDEEQKHLRHLEELEKKWLESAHEALSC